MQSGHTYELPQPQELLLNYSEWRPTQDEALEWLEGIDWLEPDYPQAKYPDSRFETRSIKVLDAPTGTGKTGMILALVAMYPNLRFLVMCATKLEQEQYTDNMMPGFEEKFKAVSIRGRSNYHCPFVNGSADDTPCDGCTLTHVSEAPCTAGMECEIKKEGGCPYYSLVGKARRSNVFTNYAYGLSMLNYAKDAFGDFDVIICDEAHVLDSQLERFIKVEVYRSRFSRLFDMELPKFDKGGSISQWSAWVRQNFNYMKEVVDGFDDTDPDEMSSDEIRNRNSAVDYLDGLCKISQLEDEWIVEDTKTKVEVKPVWVTGDSKTVLFDHANRFLLLSGTIPSAKELGRKVGIKPSGFSFYRLPYAFPVEHRLVHVQKGVPLNYKVIDENLPFLVEAVDELLFQYAYHVKVLIHTVSYKIGNYIAQNSSFSDHFHMHNSDDRIIALKEFKEAPVPAIMVSPSMDKAVDLPGDECGLIIICKIPYPYLGSPVMKLRSKNRDYYINETLMTVMQMAGRGVRNMTDVCPTYVLDAAGAGFFKSARRLIPEGFKEALRMEDT